MKRYQLVPIYNNEKPSINTSEPITELSKAALASRVNEERKAYLDDQNGSDLNNEQKLRLYNRLLHQLSALLKNAGQQGRPTNTASPSQPPSPPKIYGVNKRFEAKTSKVVDWFAQNANVDWENREIMLPEGPLSIDDVVKDLVTPQSVTLTPKQRVALKQYIKPRQFPPLLYGNRKYTDPTSRTVTRSRTTKGHSILKNLANYT